MEEPIDNLTTQSGSGDEAQTEKPVDIPPGAVGELESNAEAKNAATDNTATTSTPQAEGRSLNEEGSTPESVASDKTAVNSALDGTSLKGLEPAPAVDLIRRKSGQHIQVWVMRQNKDYSASRLQTDRDCNGRWYRVPELPPALYWSLILPTQFGEYGSTRKLFDSIVALLRNHSLLPEKECSLLTYWSISTCFPDFLPFLPSLTITGPAFAADLLLRTLVAVCRRPVLLADVSPAVLRALPLGELMPTLLIHKPHLSKRMAALLDASNLPGYWLCSGKDFQQFYCAKCIYMGEHANNQLLTPNIHVHVGGNSRRFLPPPPTDDVIQDFQNRLYSYRVTGHIDVGASKFRVPEFRFRPEVRAIAHVLGAAIVRDSELQHGLIELLQERDEQSRVDRASGEDGMVLKAVLWHCHQSDQRQVFVREIAATANRIYSEEGESLKISNETVGHVLKNLGLYTRRLGNAGRGLVLDKATQSRAHKLSHANEVLPVSAGVPVCGYCHKLQLIQTEEVV